MPVRPVDDDEDEGDDDDDELCGRRLGLVSLSTRRHRAAAQRRFSLFFSMEAAAAGRPSFYSARMTNPKMRAGLPRVLAFPSSPAGRRRLVSLRCPGYESTPIHIAPLLPTRIVINPAAPLLPRVTSTLPMKMDWTVEMFEFNPAYFPSYLLRSQLDR